MSTKFKYTSIIYEDIVKEINNRLNADPRFDNYRESSIVQQLIEIFAGVVDICNYYIERRAEECYFDTAKLRSSVILLSRLLGYVVQRPIPASAKLKIKLKGNFSDKGVQAGTKIQVPYHSIFTFEGLNLILKKTMTIALDQTMVNFMNSLGESYESDFINVDYKGNDIEVVQGEIKEKVIDGLTNPQIGQKFQLYKIEDVEFSNSYSDEDYIPPVTRVWVGNTKTEENEYKIDRRSLVNWQNFSQLNASNNKLCVIRTAITEDVELMFGDAQYTAIGASVHGTGASTIYDNIYIQYLATKGSKGNKNGIIGKKLNYNGKIYMEDGLGGSYDITDQVEFYFKNNLIGGSDLEDINSIRVNAPNIYYALDRLVTSKDYESFLKTLTSPIVIKNAIAWGEQEEINNENKNGGSVGAISKLFNIVFYTCIGEMYQVTESPYYVRTKNNGLDLTVLDNDFDENEIAERNYYNVYTFQEVVKQLKEYETSSYFYKINGNEITATQLQIYPVASTQDIIVYYNSDNYNILSSTNITINIINASNDNEFFINIANELQSSLRSLTDDRPGSPSYGEIAFENLTVEYDSNDKKIIIQNDYNDNCYVYSLSANDLFFISAIGFNNKKPNIYYGNTNVNLSNKIIEVTEKLKERSMITVQNIYISPVIQNFNIKGKVYINHLVDKEKIRIDIANEIYKWLNINADFNKPIYKSNIIDIINNFNDVKYCDIYFEPEVLTATDPKILFEGQFFYDGTFYNNGRNKYLWILNPYTNYYVKTKSIIDSQLILFLSSGTKQDPNTENLNISNININVQNYIYTWNSFINERNFFASFVKNVYNNLIETNNYVIIRWAKSNYFIREMSLIHKDLLKIIRYNMMDTSGNIAPEYDEKGKLIKGGYSLCNEICKFNVQLSYEYKN